MRAALLVSLCVCVPHSFAQSLKLGVPAGTYTPDFNAPPEQQKKDDAAPKSGSDADGKDAKELEGVTVKGKRSPASKLPTLGTDKPRDRSVVDKVTDWYERLPTDPNKLTDHEKDFLERTNKDTDPNRHVITGAPPSSESVDYGDPIEATSKAIKKP